jgi:hypothetical protein
MKSFQCWGPSTRKSRPDPVSTQKSKNRSRPKKKYRSRPVIGLGPEKYSGRDPENFSGRDLEIFQKIYQDIQFNESNLKFSIRSRPKKFQPGRLTPVATVFGSRSDISFWVTTHTRS